NWAFGFGHSLVIRVWSFGFTMTITVFTSNQPRHVALVEALGAISDRLFVVQECNTIFPGQVEDFFRKSAVMQDYFSRVIAAEAEVFGGARFLPANARGLSIKMGDLSRVELADFGDALKSDVFVVFGASYIKGALCDFLVERRALNIHMGVSPYYRGSSTNFWAMYDGRPDLVGATIHLLSRGLDSGAMLFHALPKGEAVDPFVHGMRAVRAGHAGLVQFLRESDGGRFEPVMQDKTRELRYTRNSDFTDQVALEYLGRLPTPAQMQKSLEKRDVSLFLRPMIV
ncbi:MAG TPA: formyltransferase family protein, partial [Tepidisphaeraceae bacterium]|nr:formyltransferase family protein [Tepidisphaeraceae bacterium]